jgi:putative methyltransferase
VGCLWSYAVTNPTVASNYRLAGLGVLRDPIDQVVGSLDNPAVCGFSTYVWNEQYNLQLAQAIKQRWPDCVIVFGGPNVPNQEQDYREWRAAAPWIDVTIRYEGEQAFQQMLLDNLSGDLKKDYVATRLEELDIPSPYLTGVFDSIVQDQRHQYAMTFETNRGCPFACTFCDWGSLTYSKIKKFPLERVFAEIDWAGKNQIEFVIIADANFGVFPDRDQAIVDHLIATKQQWGYPQQLNTNWYKNSNQVVLDIAEKLTQHGLNRGLTLSVQSMNDGTLTAIKRKNMRINDLSTLFRDCNRRQIPFYTELILGLPLALRQSPISAKLL